MKSINDLLAEAKAWLQDAEEEVRRKAPEQYSAPLRALVRDLADALRARDSDVALAMAVVEKVTARADRAEAALASVQEYADSANAVANRNFERAVRAETSLAACQEALREALVSNTQNFERAALAEDERDQWLALHNEKHLRALRVERELAEMTAFWKEAVDRASAVQEELAEEKAQHKRCDEFKETYHEQWMLAAEEEERLARELAQARPVAEAGVALIHFIRSKPDFHLPWRCPYMEALDTAVAALLTPPPDLSPARPAPEVPGCGLCVTGKVMPDEDTCAECAGELPGPAVTPVVHLYDSSADDKWPEPGPCEFCEVGASHPTEECTRIFLCVCGHLSHVHGVRTKGRCGDGPCPCPEPKPRGDQL